MLNWKRNKKTGECRALIEERCYYITQKKGKFWLSIDSGEPESFKTLDGAKEEAEDHLEEHPLKKGLWWSGPFRLKDSGLGVMHNWKAGSYEIGRVVSTLTEGTHRFSVYGPKIPHYSDAKSLKEAFDKLQTLTGFRNKNELDMIKEAAKEGLNKLPSQDVQIRSQPDKVAGNPSRPFKEVDGPKKRGRKASKEPKPKKEGKRAGKAYRIFDHASLAPIHWMGREEFTLEQAKKVLGHFGIDSITDKNLKYRLKAGTKASSKPNVLSEEEQGRLRMLAGIDSRKKKGKK